MIQIESLTDCLDEMKELINEHYDEVNLYPEYISCNPDYDKYLELDKTGNLILVTFREDEAIKGYCIYFVSRDLHSKDHLCAVNDVIFLHPDHRGGTESAEMLATIEEELKDRGVSTMIINMKAYKPFFSLMDFLEFNKSEYQFSKYIGKR